jgi:hypothetical protein
LIPPKAAAASIPATCASEIAKYDWPIEDAMRVMDSESSGGIVDIVNDDPSTGDYSVGCFQVNIIGKMSRSRPSEQELKNPIVNVKFAYNLWVAEGRTFCTTGGWLNTCRKVL